MTNLIIILISEQLEIKRYYCVVNRNTFIQKKFSEITALKVGQDKVITFEHKLRMIDIMT